MLDHRSLWIVATLLVPGLKANLGADIFCNRQGYTDSHCGLVVDSNGNTANDLILAAMGSCAAIATGSYGSSVTSNTALTNSAALGGSIALNSSSTLGSTNNWSFTRYSGRRRLRVSEVATKKERDLASCAGVNGCCIMGCRLLGYCASSCNLCTCRRRLEGDNLDEDFVDAMENRELQLASAVTGMASTSSRMQTSCSTSMQTLAWKLQQQGNMCLGNPAQLTCTVTTANY